MAPHPKPKNEAEDWQKWPQKWTILGAKIDEKSMQKSMPKKSWKYKKIDAKITPKFGRKSI